MSSDTRHSGAEQWARVDAYVEAHFTADDDSAALVLRRQREAGLPDIAVSPAQGKLLEVLTLAVGARRVLEFGTLGGYSTLWFARAVGPGGTVVSFELERRHADVAMASRAQIEHALHGGSKTVKVRKGPLPALPSPGWDVGMAVKDDSRDLADALDTMIAGFRTDNTLEAIFARYGVSPRTPLSI